jgi:hypothetical protein
MKRGLLTAALLLTAILLALAARTGSPGIRITNTLVDYIDSISSGDYETAHSLLTDSLGLLILPGYLCEIPDAGSSGSIELVHWDSRGFVVYLRLEEGSSRTFWFVRSNGEWRISGDTSLDNLLGRAASICRVYAEEHVAPAVRSGDLAEAFACPVTGIEYSLVDEGRLFCRAGHLGDGLDVYGDRCAASRDSLAQVVADYIATGADMPSSFEDMYRTSGGIYGQPGGFRCPDHGYSYYRLQDGSVFCPWHDEATVIHPSGQR